MIELHSVVLKPELYENIVCNTVYITGPFHYPSLLRILKQVNATGVVIVDPMITQPQVCMWAYQYASMLQGDRVGLPVTLTDVHANVSTITIA